MPFFGLQRQKPHHYREMARIVWENRDELPFALRILRDGVCDGCALGTSGLSDWTLPGTHLCMVRLELLRLNTAPSLDPKLLSDVASLRALSSQQLRELGRLPEPMPASAKAVFAPTATGFKLAVLTGQRETSAAFFPSEQSLIDNPAPQTAAFVPG